MSVAPICVNHQAEMVLCEISVGGIVLGYMYGCPEQNCGEAEDCETPEGYPKPGERSRYASDDE